MPKLLGNLSIPSGGDNPERVRSKVRSRSARQKLKEVVTKEVRHLQNAAEHRGDKDAMTYARELTRYVAGALAVTQPYEPDGSSRANGNKEEFWEWLKHMKDLLALRLPYERPRLASITLREELPADNGTYTTVYELRRMMIQKGIPVDHLDDRRMILEHELPDKQDEGRAA